jgi:hypothetical protein
MPQPLAEVFGFPVANLTAKAEKHRNERLCPFNNKSAECTKVSVTDPLGVCSVADGNGAAITCPVRFREGWIIASDAANFFFPPGANYKVLPEVRIKGADGSSAGNIDAVIARVDAHGRIIDFGSLEIQAVYISGNVREPFDFYMEDRRGRATANWDGKNYPRPDYLSSSRKRLAPQMITKGGIFKAWGKKQAIALHKDFYQTLPALEMVPVAEKNRADIAWLIYDLIQNPTENRLVLTLVDTIYTEFGAALAAITTREAGDMSTFQAHLIEKLAKI